MRKLKKGIFLHVANVLTVALVIECFLCSILVVRKYARENCYDRIEETTTQMAQMLTHAMEDSQARLSVFAEILAANNSNPEELLQKYMQNFCRTQDFSALCIHRADGTTVSWGSFIHNEAQFPDFAEEIKRVPYISEVFSHGDRPEDRYFCQVLPIVRNGEAVAILYGYMSLDKLPTFISATAYDGKCHFYLVDGDTGDFLMDTWHDGKLGNLKNFSERETKDGYEIEIMHNDIREGKSGYFVFRSKTTDDWLYTYYMPTGINNWSIQLTIDEPTAFASYNDVGLAIMTLSICVVFLMFIHVSVLMVQTAITKHTDKARLKKTRYMSEVQRALLNAHNNPDFFEQALKTVAHELQAETVLMLTFMGRNVKNSYYWPSTDRPQALDMLGRNIRDEFPVIFDQLCENKGVIYQGDDSDLPLSESAKAIFARFDVRNVMLVPITDNAGLLKGALCAVNLAKMPRDYEMLSCVTYDFFMAITNLENHAIIKQMGAMDYLTNIKNRNSYESEIGRLATEAKQNLWCVFIDVNGLHEVNNTLGHKAGDTMLCVIADVLKRTFGSSHTYRLGGDEFVAFAIDSNDEMLEKKKAAVLAELAVRGYSVSIGYAGAEHSDTTPLDLEKLIVEAETIMYEEKRAYYRNHAITEERGHFPQATVIGCHSEQ